MQGHELLDTFSKTLTGPCRVARGDQVLVCVSGGIDSMVLLDLMCKITALLELSLGVIHVEHGLRGAASERDARFVDEKCRQLRLPFHLARLGMDPLSVNLEEEARKRRYKAILDCMEHTGYVCAATGHTLDDQAETVLYRIIRGTGIRGLAGMPYRRDDGIIRPMLGITRHQVEDYAARNGLNSVQDNSNDNMRHARNLIRHSIMPIMGQINPRVAGSLASLAAIALQESAVLEMMASDIARDALVFDWGMIKAFHSEVLRAAPEAVLRRFLIDAIIGMTGEQRGIDAVQIETALRVVYGDASAHAIQRKVRLCREGTLLMVHRMSKGPFYSHTIEHSGDFFIPEIGRTVRNIVAGAYPGNVVLRSWQPGDRLHGRKVADMLMAMKVPRSLRAFWPVLESAGVIVAVALAGEQAAFSQLIMEPGHGQ